MTSIVFTSKPLLEAVRDMVFIHRFSPTGNHGPFLEVSASAIRKLEYSQEELLSLTPWDISVKKYSKADISHSICPDCLKKHYPEAYKELYPDDKDTG